MSALVSFMKQELIYEGTATDLCERFGLNIGANNLSSKLSKYKNTLQKLGVDYTKEKRNNRKVFTLNYNRKEPEYDDEFYFLEITTGLRLGEILALEWEDLDEENKTIRVNKQVRRSKNGMEVSTPKTQASIRAISISDECLKLLKGLKAK